MPEQDAPLERGRACRQCRSKKHKCGGEQPACGRCLRVNSLCQYDPIESRTVTIALQSRLEELEQRLQDLMRSDMSLAGQPSAIVPRITSTTMPPELPGRWWEPSPLVPDVHDYLMNIFFKHCEKVHSYFHLPTFVSRMASTDVQGQPHPGFLNAIYLLACYFSSVHESSSAYSLHQHEAFFLGKARAALGEALALSDRLLDFIRGSSLVAAYLILRGRYLEGYNVHSGTANSALSCGLHDIASHRPSDPLQTGGASNTPYLFPNPVTSVEVGERLLAFWQVFWIDRISTTVIGFSTALTTSLQSGSKAINSVFPREMAEYEALDESNSHSEVLTDLFRAIHVTSEGTARRVDSEFTLQLKAIGLLGRAKELASQHRLSPKDSTLQALKDHHAATNRLANELPPVAVSGTGAASDTCSLAILNARTMALGAVVELNDAVVEDPEAYQARLNAACYIASLVFYFGGNDRVRGASLVTGYCWCLSAQVLFEHVHKVKGGRSSASRASEMSLNECESELKRVLAALETLSAVFPTLASQAQRVRSAIA